jgi:hypothetical protein
LFLTDFGRFVAQIKPKMTSNNNTYRKQNLLFLAGLFIHVIINLITASFTELHFDEAYYWLFAQYPQPGYFDHPPLVAWFVRFGQSMVDGTLGLRLITILSNALALSLIWKMVKPYANNALLFWACIYSMTLLHPYGFITTPDAPLFLFTTVFFFLLKQYLEKPNFASVLMLAFTMSLMIYSKYHAFLVLGLVVLAYPVLLKKPSAWIMAFLTLIYLIPHILWQIDNDFASFRYHLIDSHKTPYRIGVSIHYLLNQLLLTGPWLGWLFLFALAKTKTDNTWERILKFNGLGIFIFFLLATLAGDNEAHWTLVAFIPLIIISIKFLADKTKWHKWIIISGGLNFTVLLLARITLATPFAEKIPGLNTLAGWRASEIELAQHTRDLPVVFQDSWNRAARFAYNTSNKKVAHLNSAFHKKNQYTLLDLDEELTGHDVYLLTRDPGQLSNPDTIVTKKETWYGQTIENFRSLYNLSFDTINTESSLNRFRAAVVFKNPYGETVELGEEIGQEGYFSIYYREKNKWKIHAIENIGKLSILPNQATMVEIDMTMPKAMDKKTEYYFMFNTSNLKPIPTKYRLP